MRKTADGCFVVADHARDAIRIWAAARALEGLEGETESIVEKAKSRAIAARDKSFPNMGVYHVRFVYNSKFDCELRCETIQEPTK